MVVLDCNVVVVSGFVNQRRLNFNFNDRHHIKPLISITKSSLLLGKANKVHIRKHNKPSHTKRTRKNDISVSKPQKVSDNAHLMSIKVKEAKLVEKLLFDAVDKMTRSRQSGINIPPSKLFPSVRQCNAALATFGDSNDFRRALKLFTQMKKSASLVSRMSTSTYGKQSTTESSDDTTTANHPTIHSIDLVLDPPKPNLVTYSTLMSRAVSLGKPRVALRLWNLMRNQPNFYTNVLSRKERDVDISGDTKTELTAMELLQKENDIIVPDSIFCNTLMNAYAKLGKHEEARSILNAMLGLKGVSCHEGIPITPPTIYTYNTLADACKTAGELGAALEVLELMSAHADISPDARTYTILISTVARKKMNDKEARDIRSGGLYDPDMAFALLNRMINEDIVPNGVTYCALIDVCARCSRCDLALNGLRLMLKQKSASSLENNVRNVPMYHQQTLFNEVGAWTACINACGKTGRVDTAIRLFRTMQQVNVKPNAVTCGCLSDCLLKATPIRLTETLEVLQYMKKEELPPSPVMYTSLMGIALSLAEKENKNVIRKDGLQVQIIDNLDTSAPSDIEEDSKTSDAIVLYTELMRCLVLDGNNDEDVLFQVFLVFQEMRSVGAKPDLACYNSLLKACILSGDTDKTKDVIRRMAADDIEPNSNTLRSTLKAARKSKRSDIADAIWNYAVRYKKKKDAASPFKPRISDVELLLRVYLSELRSTTSHEERCLINKKIMNLYEGIVNRSEDRGLHHLSVSDIEDNQDFMLAVLRAAVSNELHAPTKEEKIHAKELACDIAGMEMFQYRFPQHVDRASKKALQLAQDWMWAY